MGFFDKLFGRKEKYIPKERYTNQEGYRQHYNPYSPDARADGYAPVHGTLLEQSTKEIFCPMK